jgi:hypothetical protein
MSFVHEGFSKQSPASDENSCTTKVQRVHEKKIRARQERRIGGAPGVPRAKKMLGERGWGGTFSTEQFILYASSVPMYTPKGQKKIRIERHVFKNAIQRNDGGSHQNCETLFSREMPERREADMSFFSKTRL